MAIQEPENISRDAAVVALFDTHLAAENAVKQLQREGFPMNQLSLVGKDYHTEDHVIGYYNAGERMKFWGRLGAWWGGMAGLLFGSAFLLVPGVGHLFVLGPLAHWIMAGLEGAAVAGGVSALGAGLVSLGIPRNSIVQYESQLKAGKFLVVASGTNKDVLHARDLLRNTSPSECRDFQRVPEPA
ncbi:MAG: permease [Pseudomonadota bacterium]|nr:permease [Pseudomonadota bacterium]